MRAAEAKVKQCDNTMSSRDNTERTREPKCTRPEVRVSRERGERRGQGIMSRESAYSPLRRSLVLHKRSATRAHHRTAAVMDGERLPMAD